MEKAVELGYDLAAPEAEGDGGGFTHSIPVCSPQRRLFLWHRHGRDKTVPEARFNVFQTISNAADGGLWDLQKEQLDGMILVRPISTRASSRAKSQEYSVVLVDNWLPEISVDSVVTDNLAASCNL